MFLDVFLFSIRKRDIQPQYDTLKKWHPFPKSAARRRSTVWRRCFFFPGANVLPTARNNKKAAAREWEAAKAAMREFIGDEKDLQALSASVQVEREEYDEVACIKPVFLLEDYQ